MMEFSKDETSAAGANSSLVWQMHNGALAKCEFVHETANGCLYRDPDGVFKEGPFRTWGCEGNPQIVRGFTASTDEGIKAFILSAMSWADWLGATATMSAADLDAILAITAVKACQNGGQSKPIDYLAAACAISRGE